MITHEGHDAFGVSSNDWILDIRFPIDRKFTPCEDLLSVVFNLLLDEDDVAISSATMSS